MNEYYDHNNFPVQGAQGSSAAMRAELDLIEAGFNKLPVLTGNNNKLVKINSGGTGLSTSSVISEDGTNATITGDLIVTGGDIGQNAGQRHTVPSVASDVFALIAATQTLLNKTINLSSNTLTGTLAQFNTACSDADFVSVAGTQTLTSKTFDLANNTLTGTLAQFNSALSDADFVGLASTQTLTNKTINLTNNTLSATKAQFNTACSDGDFLFVGDVGAVTASSVSFTPSGGVVATNVQSAVVELDTEKASLSGATFSGDIVVPNEAYGAGWNGNFEAPTKDAIYDKIESISSNFAPSFTSAEQTVTFNSALNVAHGLGVIPSFYTVVLRCKTAELNYAVGDEVLFQQADVGGVNGTTTSANTANISITNASSVRILNKTTFAATTITAGNWRWVVRAWV